MAVAHQYTIGYEVQTVTLGKISTRSTLIVENQSLSKDLSESVHPEVMASK